MLHQYDRADAHTHGAAAQNQIHVVNKFFFQFFSYNSAYDTADYNSERVDNYTNRHVSFLLICFQIAGLRLHRKRRSPIFLSIYS